MGALVTISFPRSLPSAKILGVTFEADPISIATPEGGGRFVSVRVQSPIWRGEFSTTPADRVQFGKWRAWLDSLNLSDEANQFYAYDVQRPLPWTYRTGFTDLTRASSGGAFAGASTSWSVNSDRNVITIGSASGQELPAGFALIEGDYIGLQWTTSSKPRRSLHRVLEAANANGSGVGAWTIWPYVDPNVPNGATVNLVKPACICSVIERNRSAEFAQRAISFKFEQDVRF